MTSGFGSIQSMQALLVAAEAEEVVLLLERGDRLARVDRAVAAVDQLALLVVRLAGDAVRALVGVELDVAVVLDPLQQRLHGGVVAGLGGADEVVVGDVEAVPRLPEAGGVAVGLLLGRDAGRLGGLGHLQAVLVGAGEEVGVVAEEAVPAGQGVGDHRRVGVPDVGGVVHVVDRRRDVEAVGHPTQPTRRRCGPFRRGFSRLRRRRREASAGARPRRTRRRRLVGRPRRARRLERSSWRSSCAAGPVVLEAVLRACRTA